MSFANDTTTKVVIINGLRLAVRCSDPMGRVSIDVMDEKFFSWPHDDEDSRRFTSPRASQEETDKAFDTIQRLCERLQSSAAIRELTSTPAGATYLSIHIVPDAQPRHDQQHNVEVLRRNLFRRALQTIAQFKHEEENTGHRQFDTHSAPLHKDAKERLEAEICAAFDDAAIFAGNAMLNIALVAKLSALREKAVATFTPFADSRPEQDKLATALNDFRMQMTAAFQGESKRPLRKNVQDTLDTLVKSVMRSVLQVPNSGKEAARG